MKAIIAIAFGSGFGTMVGIYVAYAIDKVWEKRTKRSPRTGKP